ncbi:type I polyketide synthase [Methylobacterium persicinum]|uniref:Acyl transferase domain-containing protein/NADPH:quinone reductase-like Zn-dependent oxidoreductase/acyl carrier protein n=1 Tax=Methylobacterium persicinum TaxID=374426 RepID=A0ABU0HQZ9_9HYPH|nr:type I polyketide synthase [Methylobacterium persicinum]MDQ0444756.1 acyl transferase domain-containing protein/NADPH:quinone reductase-like Zn-dependent oxidoreductase/acyl carrier protein [Methylobacterium persicinum]
MTQRTDIAIVGRACRLPGAPSVEGLWQMLSEGRCAVSKLPPDRFSLERFLHPRAHERGKSYTFAAGALDDVWSFDPAVFGISPREAEQMDPQQRMLLELTWEALEDAGLRPSAVAGSQIGVFVGASSLDYGNLRIMDAPSGDAYTATGNTLSILSNRISYIYDLKGPSFTVDTACSSSLVAFDNAVQAIQSGRIDTAIVAGVNVLASPFNFICFSAAQMLSRTGLCQAFSKNADGYVRSEGGVVLVLRSAEAARRAGSTVRAVVAATGVNSDGRTTGISLPSGYAQAALLEKVYRDAEIAVDDLAFMEAHGTGTPVGDPIEASAIGTKLGKGRKEPLPMGSIKTNIGHTEPVSGLAGLMKATLALEHNLVPPSLHAAELNPDIPFDELNLQVVRQGLPLTRGPRQRFAGVNSFGFGGTNAHVVITDAEPVPAVRAEPSQAPQVLMISAQSRAALNELALDYAERFEAEPDAVAEIAAAVAHRRERMSTRLAVSLDGKADVAAALRAIGEGEDTDAALTGTAVDRAAEVAFVYSGNGSQWAGMGREAYEENAAFRAAFDRIDALFQTHADWSLKDALYADDLDERLVLTSVSQPLIFAIESASTAALRAKGLFPTYVLGHSVGEIAAAEAAGILTLEDAVKVIYYRSHHQETTHGQGTMAVLLMPVEEVPAFLKDFPSLDLAATNSPKAVTVAGPVADIDAALKALSRKRRRGRKLDLAYAFHGRLMDPTEKPLLRDLAGLRPQAGTVTMMSTVTGAALAGSAFGPTYWWRNIREPVRFSEAVQEATRQGARVFVEVGPRATLMSHVGDAVEPLGIEIATVGVMHRKASGGDPIAKAVNGALVLGAAVDEEKLFGTEPKGDVRLPTYPWQRRPFRLHDTTESVGALSPRPYHPLIGSRAEADGLEWHGYVDPETVPELEDHRVEGQVIMPGAGFVEMALSAARAALKDDSVILSEFEIVAPMIFAEDALREVTVRLSGSGNGIQVLSRPRLTQTPWQLHAQAKVVEGEFSPPRKPDLNGFDFDTAGDHVLSGEALYGRAVAAGLGFGPSFRQVAMAARIDDATIVADLKPAEADPRYAMVPSRLDACFHGLILLFADLLGEGAGKAYIPVRFGEIRLVQPGAVIARSVIRTRRCNERSILADFTLLDPAGEVVATIREGRFQALRSKGGDELAAYAISQVAELATEPTAIPAERRPSVAVRLRPLSAGVKGSAEASLSPGHLLLEGWATSLAYRLAKGLADASGTVALADPRLPAALRPWLVNGLYALESSGLAEHEGGAWRLGDGSALPAPDEIMRWIAADHPDLSAELVLVADVGATVDRILAGDVAEAPNLPSSAVDAFVLRSATSRHSANTVAAVLDQALGQLPKERALRVLQVGYGPLSAQAATFAVTAEARFTILETDRRLAERARLSFGRTATLVEAATELAPGGFDLIIAAGSLHRGERGLLKDLSQALATGGLMVAVEPGISLFCDLVFGLTPEWFEDGAGDMPIGRLDDIGGWQRSLSAAGLVSVSVDRAISGNGDDLLLVAEAPARPMPAPAQSFAFIIGSDDDFAAETASSLATLLVAGGVHVSIILDSETSLMELERETPDTVVFLAGAFSRGGEAAERLRDRCLSLKRCVEHLGARQTGLWIVAPGATRDRGGQTTNVEAGVWAFSRTLANEVPNLDIRRIDLSPEMSSKRASERLRDLILSGTPETEIVLDDECTQVVRFHAGRPRHRDPADTVPAEAARLERSNTGGLNEMVWGPAERRTPGRGEMEIAVEATGLNFRDVLWALSMLPEEILEDGFAGPRLGLECAGTVSAVGPGVKGFKVGDPVVAFAQSGFSTHIVVPDLVVAPMPQGVDPMAAATVPVAFLTAYYALVSCARMRRGEWVLVHGGAGGVGLAALQIAKLKGARVIATAGSREKRALVKALGAEHVLDSRSLAFVDDVRAITGEGVDIVLNSLFGEAMERSLNALRPFGRFVELGKRDYVANTHIGLRPFRRNLSYFGVDLDQVIQHQGDDGARMFREVMALFNDGGLKPLPYQPFTAAETSDAFRLMQQSGHIGKIVISPPKAGSVLKDVAKPFAVSPEGVHLVTGGLGGFGLEAARWLADRGARHIVLSGRKGATTDEAKALLAELSERGVRVEAKAVDITSRSAVDRMLAEIEGGGRKLAGVIHAAAVLQDGLVANLDVSALDAVIGPKVIGAQHLDAATRDRVLDYFVLFSSATTFIGNPGQGSYVAANGFMEGLARQRRRRGLPALAVAWGAIGDVGMLARNKAVMETLAGRVGVTPMEARRCLDLMAEALSSQGHAPDEAVIAIAAMHWGKARERLATMRSPSYAELGSDQVAEAGSVQAISIASLLKGSDVDTVRKTVSDAIVEDIARILRLPKDDISRVRQLSEIGLDSLMGVELGASLQERFGLESPPAGLSSGMTVNELSESLIQAVSAPMDDTAGVAMSLMAKHIGGEVSASVMAPLRDLIEARENESKEIQQ